MNGDSIRGISDCAVETILGRAGTKSGFRHLRMGHHELGHHELGHQKC